ncbi:hypothetical protein TRAPUB_3170 [Trametes pubescens]|uniref:Uncharacterized protein n=1 Tax=Trametes pubescens TaxID=154538 RepID=A0A1M2VEN2_TRAPU|nr:hypothetical protein TRAPUB_3170 [Trametes pubescens]
MSDCQNASDSAGRIVIGTPSSYRQSKDITTEHLHEHHADVRAAIRVHIPWPSSRLERTIQEDFLLSDGLLKSLLWAKYISQ